MNILPLRAFHDNIIWMIADEASRSAVAVDPGEAAPVEAFLSERGMRLAAILITHHHHDHTGGVPGLVSRYQVPVYGPSEENIPGVSRNLAGIGKFTVEQMGFVITAMKTPGHTRGHLVYLLDDSGAIHAFTGDTLFSGGCGRIFEGTAEGMYNSLMRISSLPDHTLIYPGHDYLEGNARFINLVEPENRDFHHFMQEAERMHREGKLPLPAGLGMEKKINPFLRCGAATVKRSAEARARRELAGDAEVFRVLREWKNEI